MSFGESMGAPLIKPSLPLEAVVANGVQRKATTIAEGHISLCFNRVYGYLSGKRKDLDPRAGSIRNVSN